MSVVVGIPKEQTPGERRIALVPDTVKRLTKLGATVVIEKGMGESAYFKDAVYTSAGAQIAGCQTLPTSRHRSQSATTD